MAWTELDALGGSSTDLEQAADSIGPDQHRQVAELQGPDRVAVGVKHVFVGHPVLAGARRGDRIYLASM